MDTASSQPGELTLSLPSVHRAGSPEAHVDVPATASSVLPLEIVQELWLSAAAESCDLTRDEFTTALETVGAKCNHGVAPEFHPDSAQRSRFSEPFACPNWPLLKLAPWVAKLPGSVSLASTALP